MIAPCVCHDAPRLPTVQQPIPDEDRDQTVFTIFRTADIPQPAWMDLLLVSYENLVSDGGCCTYYRLSLRVNRLLRFFVTLICHRKIQRDESVFNGSY